MFEIYEAKLTKFGAPAYVFVTAYQNKGGYLKAEAFCSFPEAHTSPIAKRLKCEFRELEDKTLAFDENTMLQLAQDEAKHLISRHIDTNYQNKEWMLNSDGVALNRIDSRTLTLLQLRGMAGFIKEIAQETECDQLERELNQIMTFPIVTSTPIPLE